ncbi:MAG TPA: lipoyl synthase [Candidatus Kapabacteria bacterium]|nr:lipoyl synthase [Candidatus Kapabacteria bacterium]
MDVLKVLGPDVLSIRDRKPPWFKVQAPGSPRYRELNRLIREENLHTVCQEAACPNVGDCWDRGTATFMILGDTCTRSCGFCAVKTGRPGTIDLEEPARVADAIESMGIRHAVITSVNRDELADGGAGVFAETIRQSRARVPGLRLEVLIPDFKGKLDLLQLIIDAKPDILNHNTETVPSLYRTVRPQGRYDWTLSVLAEAKRQGMTTKTGIMLGLGEEREELLATMRDLADRGVDVLTLGQYLQPTKSHLPVVRFVHPDEFDELRDRGLEMGFRFVESGPLVRSSYHAERHV